MHRNIHTACRKGVLEGVLLSVVISVGVLSGCSTQSGKSASATKATAAKNVKHEYVIINDKSQASGKQRAGKDQHHLEYEKKRAWYNRVWVDKQEAEKQAKRDAYHRKYQQAQSQPQQQLPHYGAVNVQQHSLAQALPHYGQQPIINGQSRQQQPKRIATRSGRSNVNLAEHLSNAAIARTYQRVRYDGRYIPISYPMGDVPASIGVCTDTVIRSYRRLGIDLQRLVHEDMSRAFHAYPNLPKWGLSAPDPNIDHRRVHNLKVFFSRYGRRLPVTNNPEDYRPGDLVTWHLGGDQEHIGIVVNRRSPQDPRRHMIVHNIANGDRMEDVLFTMPITGHYRYLPARQPWIALR